MVYWVLRKGAWFGSIAGARFAEIAVDGSEAAGVVSRDLF